MARYLIEKTLDISRIYGYIYKVRGNEPSDTRESNMQHKILIRRAIRDEAGRFTGLYRSSLNIPMIGIVTYPKTLACVQVLILIAVFSHYV